MTDTSPPLLIVRRPLKVGIVGGGIAGMYTALLLKRAGYDFHIFEGSGRVGGRVDTRWFREETDQYLEAGAMRIPDDNFQKLTFDLVDYLNDKVTDTGVDRSIELIDYNLNSDGNNLYVNGKLMNATDATPRELGWDVPYAWRDKKAFKILTDALKDPLDDLKTAMDSDDFDKAFRDIIKKYDSYSLRQYITIQGVPSDVVDFVETVLTQTNQYATSLPANLVQCCDFLLKHNWKTIKGGMSRLPEAMEALIGLENITYGARVRSVHTTLSPSFPPRRGPYNTFSNFLGPSPPSQAPGQIPRLSQAPRQIPPPSQAPRQIPPPSQAPRKIPPSVQPPVQILPPVQPTVHITATGCHGVIEACFDAVVLAIPPAALKMLAAHDHWSPQKQMAIRSTHIVPLYKMGLRFKRRFWEDKDIACLGGQSTTDLPIRWVVFPSYGIRTSEDHQSSDVTGVLMLYSWMTDATTWVPLTVPERVSLALDNLETLYEGRVRDVNGEPTTVTSLLIEAIDAIWAESNSTGDSFTLPYQLSQNFDHMRNPEGAVYFAGEHLSFHNTWISGACDSAIWTTGKLLGKKVPPLSKDYKDDEAPEMRDWPTLPPTIFTPTDPLLLRAHRCQDTGQSPALEIMPPFLGTGDDHPIGPEIGRHFHLGDAFKGLKLSE